MAQRIHAAVVVAASAALLAILPAAARTDGLPIPGVSVKPGGVATRDGRTHFVTKSTTARTTVRMVDSASGRTILAKTIAGDYTVPAVALDGTPGGLAANGRLLTLIHPRRKFPQAATHLVVLGTRSLKVRRRLDLRGDFSFDAISPSGNRIYLIQYQSIHDPTDYAVRAYDTTTGRMLPKPVVDPTEPEEQMRGLPVTRVASPDGRWQYTLYTGSKAPFIHALNTPRGSARCIDLPKFAGSIYAHSLRISPDGGTLSVTNRNRGGVATVDTSTFAVSRPGASAAEPRGGSSDGAFPWLLIGLGALLALAVGSLWGMPRIRRRRLAGSG